MRKNFTSDVLLACNSQNLEKINRHTHFLTFFNKYIRTFIEKGYDRSILQRTACLVVNPFTIGNH